MRPMSRRLRVTYFVSAVVLFIAALPFVILYANGYRFNEGDVVETGGVYVFVPHRGASIFIDGEFRRRTGNFQRELFVQNIDPSALHTVSVEHPEYTFWQKQVGVDPHEVTALYPFLLPHVYEVAEINQFINEGDQSALIPEENQSYISYLELFEEDEKLVAASVSSLTEAGIEEVEKIERDNILIWFDDHGVYAEWSLEEGWIPRYFCHNGECERILTVVSPRNAVVALDYYPDRDDVVVYATRAGVYVAEIDTRSVQVHRQIFAGTDVDMRIVRDSNIIIRDGERLFEINL